MLRLLVLLQARSRWSGRELAGRLEVSVRTLRYDIDKLRQLGYPGPSGTGAAGGYELQPGPVLPPLLLYDDEAVAMAIGLQLAAGAGGGLGEPASTALAKLHQLLPRRLCGRITALRRYTASVPHGSSMVELASPGQPAIQIDGYDRDQVDRAVHEVAGLGWYLRPAIGSRASGRTMKLPDQRHPRIRNSAPGQDGIEPLAPRSFTNPCTRHSKKAPSGIGRGL